MLLLMMSPKQLCQNLMQGLKHLPALHVFEPDIVSAMSYQIQQPGRHLVLWDHHSGAGTRPCSICQAAAHEGALDDHSEPSTHPRIRQRQEAFLEGIDTPSDLCNVPLLHASVTRGCT